MFEREGAWRIFAKEFNDSDYIKREVEEGEKNPSYLVTPTGAYINRVLIAGFCNDINEISCKDGSTLILARVDDTTGVFNISAGQYQPKALNSLRSLKSEIDEKLGRWIIVVGKVSTREWEGRLRPSIRAESLISIDAAVKSYWTLETATHTLVRVELLNATERYDMGDLDTKYPKDAIENALLAIEHYSNKSQEYFDMTREVLENMLYASPFKTSEESLPKLSEDDVEEVFNIIREETAGTLKDISLEDIRSKATGIDEEKIETIIRHLTDSGRKEEKEMGWFNIG